LVLVYDVYIFIHVVSTPETAWSIAYLGIIKPANLTLQAEYLPCLFLINKGQTMLQLSW